MALNQGTALPDVNTTTAQTTTAPDYYTNYLSNLASAGNAATAVPADKMVAGFTDLQNQGFSGVDAASKAAQPGLTAATDTANTAALGVGADQINNFMNPYTNAVVNNMGILSEQNMNRNILPQLKAGFVGTGGLGSQRFANAAGQTAADIGSNLLTQQTGALSTGYDNAVKSALANAGLLNTAATTQGNLAKLNQDTSLTGVNALLAAGAQQQAQNQATIDAPLKTATNASALLRGYNVPTSTTQKYTGPMPGAYSASPLQTIAGLGALFASGSNGTSAAGGFTDWIKKNFPDVKLSDLGLPDSPTSPIIPDNGGVDGVVTTPDTAVAEIPPIIPDNGGTDGG